MPIVGVGGGKHAYNMYYYSCTSPGHGKLCKLMFFHFVECVIQPLLCALLKGVWRYVHVFKKEKN